MKSVFPTEVFAQHVFEIGVNLLCCWDHRS